jgi:hypothetical protein
MDHPKRYEFTGELFQGPRGGFYIDFPFDVEKEFGTKKQVKVKIWFDGHLVRKSLLPKGDGKHWLSVSMDIRAAIGKGDGDMVTVVVEADKEPRIVQPPEDLEWLLDNDPEMKEVFSRQSYNTLKFFCNWVSQATNPGIRVNRINQVFEWLERNKSNKRPGGLKPEDMKE